MLAQAPRFEPDALLPTVSLGDLALTATRPKDEVVARPRSSDVNPTEPGSASWTARTSEISSLMRGRHRVRPPVRPHRWSALGDCVYAAEANFLRALLDEQL
jgi:hypothetical protein